MKDDPTRHISIIWTPEKLEAFKQEFNKTIKKAVADGVSPRDAVFKFEGHDVLCAYAAYLIQYLETKFK